MSVEINQQVKVPGNYAGVRLDQIASELFPDYSRSRLQGWIKGGELLTDGLKKKPNAKLGGGETLTLTARLADSEEWLPEPVDFDIVYEDDDMIVVNKPVSLVVHPAAGNWSGTLLNGLLYRFPELTQLPRAGIVHRLDKDTSGLMVVARSLVAQVALVEQLQARTVSRTYWAFAQGHIDKSGTVDAPIGRHPTARTKMAVVKSGKEARTHYRLLRSFYNCCLVELKLETGRTHQIRVHMAEIGHPLIGDPVYGNLKQDPDISMLERQALHAKALGLKHPVSGELMSWEVDLPADLDTLFCELKAEL